MIEKQIKETIERVYWRKFPTHRELKDIDYLTELLTKLFTEQLHKPDVSGSVCDHTYISMEEPMIVKFTHQCSKCGKTKAN